MKQSEAFKAQRGGGGEQVQIYVTERIKFYKINIICFSMNRKVKLMTAIFSVFTTV
jgi:hypothetical protein